MRILAQWWHGQPGLTESERVELRRQQIIYVAKQTPWIAVTNIINPLAVAAMFWNSAPRPLMAIWAAALLFMAAWGLRSWARNRNREAPARVSRKTARKAILGGIIAGCLWGAASVFLFTPESMLNVVFLVFVVGGMGAGALASLFPFPAVGLGFIIPSLVPLSLRLLLSGEQTLIVGGGILGLYMVALVLFSRNGYQTFVENVRIQIRNRDLSERAAQAQKEAEEGNRAKSEFLSMMSHELRTPLNAVLGFSEIIKNETLGAHSDPRYKDYGSDIHRAGSHLLGIVNDILDLSRVEAGRFELYEERISVPHALRSATRMVEMAASRKDLAIDFNIADELPLLRADPRVFKQMLVNLLSNAVKYTPAGGSIIVSAGCTDDGLRVAIADTGVGMTDEQIPQALKPFSQIDSGYSRSQEGTGLGLSLVKSLIELHGGALEIRSALGKGTTAALKFGPHSVIPPDDQGPPTAH